MINVLKYKHVQRIPTENFTDNHYYYHCGGCYCYFGNTCAIVAEPGQKDRAAANPRTIVREQNQKSRPNSQRALDGARSDCCR